jgi:hypothetical protein
MYVPPPGRPISSPPCEPTVTIPAFNSATRYKRFTEAERQDIITSYRNGETVNEIAARYGRWHSSVGRVIARSKPTQMPPGRPVRLPGETKHQYANRVQVWMRANNPEWAAAWRAKMSAGVKKSWRKRKAAKARAAAALQPVQPAADIRPAIVAAPPPPPPPSLWQRIVGLFR